MRHPERGHGFVIKQFDKHAETTVEKATMEVNAYVTQNLQRAGLQALTGGDVPFQLTTGEDDDAP